MYVNKCGVSHEGCLAAVDINLPMVIRLTSVHLSVCVCVCLLRVCVHVIRLSVSPLVTYVHIWCYKVWVAIGYLDKASLVA